VSRWGELAHEVPVQHVGVGVAHVGVPVSHVGVGVGVGHVAPPPPPAAAPNGHSLPPPLLTAALDTHPGDDRLTYGAMAADQPAIYVVP